MCWRRHSGAVAWDRDGCRGSLLRGAVDNTRRLLIAKLNITLRAAYGASVGSVTGPVGADCD